MTSQLFSVILMAMAASVVLAPVSAFGLSGYEVSFEFSNGEELKAELQQGSRTLQLQDRPPPTLYLLNHRAQKDLPILKEILTARGHFKPEVSAQVKDGQKDEAHVVFSVTPGPVYDFHSVEIELQTSGPGPQLELPTAEDLGLAPGTPALAQKIRSARQALTRNIAEQGYVYASQDKPVLVVDHDQRHVEVTFTLAPGPLADFGQIGLEGLEHVEPEYVLSKTGWEPGQRYDPDKIEAFQERLLNTGLFSMVQVRPHETLTDKGRLPITVVLEERKRRSVSLGVGYDTDVGPNLSASWEDRNLLGKGENLRFELGLSAPEQEIAAKYRQPFFFRTDQSLIVQAALRNEDTEAYMSTGGEVSMDVERSLSSRDTVSIGVTYSFSDLEDVEETEFFHLLSFPLIFDHDARKDVLDPRDGHRFNIKLEPYQELAPSSNQFLQTILSGWWYVQLSDPTVLALRGKVGSISGVGTSAVPADVRFYAGGGGSVRGYPFQEVGPRKDNDPFGGRSLVEASIELRHTFTNRFGGAVFVDGGNVYDEALPEFDPSPRFGAGLGLRYYTPVGPLRLDVAFPLNRDPDNHDAFQVYISLGQAF